MPRSLLSPQALPALLVALLALALPLPALDGPGGATARAGSVDAREASVDPVAAPAQAFPIESTALQAARGVAIAHWNGTEPCSGRVRISWTSLDPGVNATASWRNPTDAWNNAAANFDCTIELNARAEYDFPKLCTVLAHELGHLLGNPHADRDGQLMSAFYSEPLSACSSADPNAASPAAAAAARSGPAARQPLRRAVAGKPVARRTTVTRTAEKRCVVRFRAGKRTKRCTSAKAARARGAARAARS